MRRPAYAILTAALFLVPASLAAQDALPRPLNATENIEVTGVGDGIVANWANVYVGPYNGILLSDPTHPQLTLYCVDYADEVSKGDSWDVNVTNLAGGSGTDMSNTLVGDFGKYQEAAYLSSLFDSWQSYGTSERTVYSGIHAAIWSIMTNGFPNAYPGWGMNATLATSMATPFENLATQNAGNFDLTGWSVLSDVGATNNGQTGQEYLVHTTVTPEPETYILLLTGIVVLFGITWLQRRHANELA